MNIDETYLDLKPQERKFCQHLLLKKYIDEGLSDMQIYAVLNGDMKYFEKTEQFEHAQLRLDTLKYFLSL